ncbi:helix-turn-helix protein [Albidovulum inexpectatum]|uniref:Helix-turn-helix protein n=1 Tax=Albidovulum inexpectatum TaxID=196587 RepID=A0A2S5JFA0_9RHOB|nr:helix-turn-helix transcriptional regulator [Albidovulum inexpectatum]PPB80162.1 helix-turn-helix protein [Albidovulum inexpectatum]
MQDRDTTDTNWFSDDAATFGDRLAAAREAAGLSQSDLAQRLGIRKKTLIQWETDRTEPRANRLQMLAGMLGVSIRWLLTGEGEGIELDEDGQPLRRDAAGVIAEIRELRTALGTIATRLGQLEKRLRETTDKDLA